MKLFKWCQFVCLLITCQSSLPSQLAPGPLWPNGCFAKCERSINYNITITYNDDCSLNCCWKHKLLCENVNVSEYAGSALRLLLKGGWIHFNAPANSTTTWAVGDTCSSSSSPETDCNSVCSLTASNWEPSVLQPKTTYSHSTGSGSHLLFNLLLISWGHNRKKRRFWMVMKQSHINFSLYIME